MHSKKPKPLDFKSEQERTQWMIENAEYFTVIRRQKRRNEREEHPTLEAAEGAANRWVRRAPDARLLIYAVHGVHDAYVKTIQAVHEPDKVAADDGGV